MADLSSEELKTKEFYDENAQNWLESLAVGKDSLLFEQELTKFKTYLPSGLILEVGCGAGNDAKGFLNNKYRYRY